MYIKQISVYLENVKGSLRELCQLLGENGINLLALSVADTTGFGIVRCIVKSSDTDRAAELLKSSGHIARVNKVVCVSIPHRPCGLARVLELLEENDLSVEYSYSFCRSTSADAVIILRPSEREKCERVLEENGVRTISQTEVDEF